MFIIMKRSVIHMLLSVCLLVFVLNRGLAVPTKSTKVNPTVTGRPTLGLELPSTIQFDPETFLIGNYSAVTSNLTLEEELTLTGLDDLEDELSFNYITRSLELGLHFPNFRLQGPFTLKGDHMWCPWGCEVTIFNVSGTLEVNLEQGGGEDNNTIFIKGRVQRGISPIAFETFEIEHGYTISVSNLQGTIDNQPPSEVTVLNYLNNYFATNVTQSIPDRVHSILYDSFQDVFLKTLLDNTATCSG